MKPLLAVDGPHNLGAAARQAVAQIQSRLTGATPGQLALADGDAGQLSLAAEDAHGWVSMEGEGPVGEADPSTVDGEEEASAPRPPGPRSRQTE